MKKIRLIVFVLLFLSFVFSLFAETDYYIYPKRKPIKPYMGLDLSQDWKPLVPAPFEERYSSPGMALNFGFRF